MSKTTTKQKPYSKAQPATPRRNVKATKVADLDQLLEQDRLDTNFALLFHMHGNGLAAMTFHKVSRQDQGASQIQPGRILSPADEMHILRLLARPAEDRGLAILPEGVLHAGEDHALWWVPGSIRPMLLNVYGTGRQELNVHWPHLVMMAYNRRIFVAALADGTRPGPTTPLFHAPLGNIYASSETCLGDCKPPVNSTADSIEEWNAVIFDSAFSHSNHNQAMATGDVMDYWKKKRRKPVPVPTKSLTPMRLTLAEWYERIITG